MDINGSGRLVQDQNLKMQLNALQKADCEKVFQKKASGIKSDKLELAAMQHVFLKGDVIYIYKLDGTSCPTVGALLKTAPGTDFQF